MVEEKSNFLKTIAFKSTWNWNIKQIFSGSPIRSQFEFVHIGKHIYRRKDAMKVENGNHYKRITIKTNNGGVVVRDIASGNAIKTKDQYYIKTGQLAVSKIDARNGAFGAVPMEADKAIITGNFWVYDVDDTKANIQYLILIFSSQKFVQAWQDCSNGSGNRLYLQENKFLKYKIPFPKLEEQNRLIKKYENTIAEAEACEKEVERLEASVETYLFDSLGIIVSTDKASTTNLLSFTGLNKLFKWGADFNLNAINPKDIFKSTKYKNVPITSLCKINPITKYTDDVEDISFVPMECVSDIYGEIISMKQGKASLSKGYTRFQENDVIWAKITPCMQNGKSAVANGLDNGFAYGSTEYHVFRAFEEKALPEYIHAFMRTAYVRKVAQTYFTGSAGQQRVGTDFLEALTLPAIPIVSEDLDVMTQTNIVNHISDLKLQIKALRQKAESLRSLAKKEFEEAVFSE